MRIPYLISFSFWLCGGPLGGGLSKVLYTVFVGGLYVSIEL